MQSEAKTSDKLLSRDEVEEHFGIPKRFLERAVKSRIGPNYVKVGRLVRYKPVDILQWIELQTVESTGQVAN